MLGRRSSWGPWPSPGRLPCRHPRAEATLAIANGLSSPCSCWAVSSCRSTDLPGVLADLGGLPAAALSDALRIGSVRSGDALGPLLLLGAWGVATTVLAARMFAGSSRDAAGPANQGFSRFSASWRSTSRWTSSSRFSWTRRPMYTATIHGQRRLTIAPATTAMT